MASTPIPARLWDPARRSISPADIKALERNAGRRLSVAELAAAFPLARIEARGATLEALSRATIDKPGVGSGVLSLGQATVDKNGDLDVTPLLKESLVRHNSNLVLHKGDELPVPLSQSLANGALVVREAAHQAALKGAGFPSGNGALRVDLRDGTQVRRALSRLGVDPADPEEIGRELAAHGVAVPLGEEDRLRRVLVGRLDSPRNEVDLDDALVERVGEHNAGLRPTVYASAKVSPERLGEVILTYKRFNNQSFAGQGHWTAQLLGKDRASQHEGDSEAVFVKLDARTLEVESVLAARHYYGELYSKAELSALEQRTGREDLTTSVSHLAHGSRLAEPSLENVWAGHGADGVRRGDLRDYVFKDRFPGFSDAAPGGKAVFVPREQIRLVFESDDQQSLNLQVQIGATRKGLFGTGLLDVFNDGAPPDRFGGTDWFHKQEQLNVAADAAAAPRVRRPRR